MAANGTASTLNVSEPACPLMGNFSWQEEYLTPTNSILLIVAVTAESVMIPFTVLLNALVIFLVWRKHYLRKQQPCVLLACLAATDLLVGAVVLPLIITAHASRLSRAPVCLVDAVAWSTTFLGFVASLCHLVVISGERYVAIKHSLRYETLVTVPRLTAAVATAWAIPVATTLSSFINIGLGDMIYFVIIFVGIPGSLIAICFCQVVVFLESRRHRRHIRAQQVSEAAARELFKQDKAARTTTIIVGALLLCYAPTILSDAVAVTVDLPMDATFGAVYVTEVFICANSLVNPIIYCMRTKDFQRALRELFGLDAPQVDAQAAGTSAGVVSRQSSEAPRPSSSGQRQIAWAEAAPARNSRSHSFDSTSRDSPNERRNSRKNTV